eukprot:s1349_g9.t1
MISEQYPRALAKRRKEEEEELRETEENAQLQRQAEVTGDTTDGARDPEAVILPILRSRKLALPQSRVDQDLSREDEQLVQYALQGGRRICLLKEGEELGICMTVEDFRQLGPASQAKMVGKSRVRLMEPPQLHEGGFELGRFQAVFDTPLPLSELAPVLEGGSEEETAAQIAQKCTELMNRQIDMLGPGSRYVFTQSCGELPAVFRRRPGSALTFTSPDMEVLSFWLLGAIIMDASQRTRLLQSTDTRERLLACYGKMQAAGSKNVLNLPGADSWMHPGQSSWSSIVLLVVIFALLVAKASGLFDGIMGRQRGMQMTRFM